MSNLDVFIYGEEVLPRKPARAVTIDDDGYIRYQDTGELTAYQNPERMKQMVAAIRERRTTYRSFEEIRKELPRSLVWETRTCQSCTRIFNELKSETSWLCRTCRATVNGNSQ